jgi:hypothetical protein
VVVADRVVGARLVPAFVAQLDLGAAVLERPDDPRDKGLLAGFRVQPGPAMGKRASRLQLDDRALDDAPLAEVEDVRLTDGADRAGGGEPLLDPLRVGDEGPGHLGRRRGPDHEADRGDGHDVHGGLLGTQLGWRGRSGRPRA